jgi:hypothetical protein
VPPVVAPSPGGRCGNDLGPSPFTRKDATHILVADFFASRASEPDFADSVSHQIDSELRRYKDDLRDPRKMDVEVPEDSIELQRLRCFVEDHAQAREIAKALGADLVVWGKAFCELGSTVVVNDNSQVKVEVQGGVIAGANSVIKMGTREIQTPKRYTVCPSATLYRDDRDFRRTAERGMKLDSLGDLDLPALRATEPFQLVHFTLGLHFYERQSWWLAARFFKQSADDVLAGERNVEMLERYLGQAYVYLPDLPRSLEYSRRALERVAGSGTVLGADPRLISSPYQFCIRLPAS